MIERERLIEIGASVAGVGVMVALLYYIGANHAEEAADGHQVLSPSGGELVIYSRIAFIVLMAAVGVLLMRTVTVPEAAADSA